HPLRRTRPNRLAASIHLSGWRLCRAFNQLSILKYAVRSLMADNNQVWAVSTPGAPHDARLARQAAYATTGGVTGIVASSGPGVGLTPGVPMSVRLDPCSVVAASTYAGARRESYSFDVPEAIDVAVTTTGSGSRTDVIALVVTDPVLEGREIMEIGEDGTPLPGSEGINPQEH